MPRHEEATCRLCGFGQASAIWREEPYRVLWCPACDACAVSAASLPTLDGTYSQSYFETFYLSDESRRARFFRDQLVAIQRLVAPGMALDVGCGVGLFLRVARDAGWKSTGVEPSTFAAQFACQRHGLQVIRGDLIAAQLLRASFDLVTFWDVLAHVPDPRRNVEKAQALLKPGGLLIIKTPRRGRLAFRVASRLSPFTATRGLLHVPAQLFHFTPKSLRRLVESCGFTVARLVHVAELRPHVATAHWQVRLAVTGLHGLRRAFGLKESLILYAKAP